MRFITSSRLLLWNLLILLIIGECLRETTGISTDITMRFILALIVLILLLLVVVASARCIVGETPCGGEDCYLQDGSNHQEQAHHLDISSSPGDDTPICQDF